jgi:hypothetical protein
VDIVKLWLDDVRNPLEYGFIDWVWAKTAEEAIAVLRTGLVKQASLDHDLAWEHYPWNDARGPHVEQTGYDVVCWMEQNNIWPIDGIRVHSQNPVGSKKMRDVCRKHYGAAQDERFGPPPKIVRV